MKKEGERRCDHRHDLFTTDLREALDDHSHPRRVAI
jgi:hypothetical protein